LIANCYLQEQILNNSKRPIEDARSCYVMLPHAGVFKVKFNRDVNTQLETFQVESWLNYHGEKLEKRFQLSAYKMMNQLLKR
jgi:homoserine acetyltransferase